MILPKTIKTEISDKTITKVTRLFNATLEDILNELLQNARRAGATEIHITAAVGGEEPSLTIQDDGAGIDDPQKLLSFGDSGWNSATQQQEDPAGMGVFSLSNRGATICSNDWQVTISPEQFAGEGDVSVHRIEAIYLMSTNLAG